LFVNVKRIIYVLFQWAIIFSLTLGLR